MGLSSVTPRAFNSTGAQSVCRANRSTDGELIESEFLSKCQMQYINGTGPNIVRGSLKALPTTTLPTSGLNQDTFTVESDIDAISGMDLSISVRFDDVMNAVNIDSSFVPQSYATADLKPCLLPKDFLLSIINKVEVNIGGHLHQTILPQEIFMRNLTEQCTTNLDDWLNHGVDNQFKNNYDGPYSTLKLGSNSTTSGFHPDIIKLSNKRTSNQMLLIQGSEYTFTVSLPVTGRSIDMHSSFLQSGAVTNNIKLIVYYNQLFPTSNLQYMGDGTGTPVSVSAGSISVIRDPTTTKRWVRTYRSWLTVKDHVFTETESEFLKSNIVNRVVNTSQSVVREITAGETLDSDKEKTPFVGTSQLYVNKSSTAGDELNVDLDIPDWKIGGNTGTLVSKIDKNTVPVTVDLSSFDLNASHLLISAFASTHQSDGSISISPFDTALETNGTQDTNTGNQYNLSPYILERNSGGSSTSVGISDNIPVLHVADLFAFTGYSHADTSLLSRPDASNMRGILSGWLDSVEVKLGSETTGRIPSTALIKTGQDFGLTSAGGAPVYVVPLADKPFSTAGIPMSRIGQAQVVLHVDPRYAMYFGPFTQSGGNYKTPGEGETQITGLPAQATGQQIKPWAPVTKIAVVGVGTKVQTTVGGSTSFA